jgi:hypothetical protein
VVFGAWIEGENVVNDCFVFGCFSESLFGFVSLKKGKLLLFYPENLGILRGVRLVKKRCEFRVKWLDYIWRNFLQAKLNIYLK